MEQVNCIRHEWYKIEHGLRANIEWVNCKKCGMNKEDYVEEEQYYELGGGLGKVYKPRYTYYNPDSGDYI